MADSTRTISICLNNTDLQLGAGCTLADALLEVDVNGHSKGVAVALNEEVIPKEHWSATQLKNGDALLVITATQGG